ncbi:MAG: hypothetical protein AAF354_12025, partial [Pseudomonadota bacterium]
VVTEAQTPVEQEAEIENVFVEATPLPAVDASIETRDQASDTLEPVEEAADEPDIQTAPEPLVALGEEDDPADGIRPSETPALGIARQSLGRRRAFSYSRDTLLPMIAKLKSQIDSRRSLGQ